MQRNSEVNLYCKLESDKTPVLYRSPSIPDHRCRHRRSEKSWPQGLVYLGGRLRGVWKCFVGLAQDAMDDVSITPEERFSFLQSAAAAEVNAAFQMIKCDQFVGLAQTLSGQIANLLGSNAIVPRQLFAMVQHDFYTFTHVTNVAGFANLLAEKLGYTDPDVKEQITVGAFLHDIGKRSIPGPLLCKKGALAETEWNLIQDSSPTRLRRNVRSRGLDRRSKDDGLLASRKR